MVRQNASIKASSMHNSFRFFIAPLLSFYDTKTALTCQPGQNKNAAEKQQRVYIARKSDGALNLVGAEASGTSVHMAGSSVNDSLNALDVGLPCTIGTSVGVRDLNAEGHALTTKITLSHFIAPPILTQ
jgi:hypothetical protein